MKNNNNLKICFAIVLSFAMCSLKAQSLQQNFQKDMEQRKKHTDAIRMKAKEQQEQQKAEKTTEANIPQQSSASNVIQPNTQPAPLQQKKEDVKPQTPADIKKPVATKKVPAKAAHY